MKFKERCGWWLSEWFALAGSIVGILTFNLLGSSHWGLDVQIWLDERGWKLFVSGDELMDKIKENNKEDK